MGHMFYAWDPSDIQCRKTPAWILYELKAEICNKKCIVLCQLHKMKILMTIYSNIISTALTLVIATFGQQLHSVSKQNQTARLAYPTFLTRAFCAPLAQQCFSALVLELLLAGGRLTVWPLPCVCTHWAPTASQWHQFHRLCWGITCQVVLRITTSILVPP